MTTQKAVVGKRYAHSTIEERLPEVKLIKDKELRDKTKDALSRMLPEYFWSAPATSSGYYHNPYSRGKHGLWIHVKMAATMYERLVRSYIEQGLITEFEADCGRAAILLHDGLKYGHSYEEGDSTLENHDKMAAAWIRANTNLPSEVADAVAAHNGPWYAGPSPSTPLEQLVHLCDMCASTKNSTTGLYEPHKKIRGRFPSIPRAEL